MNGLVKNNKQDNAVMAANIEIIFKININYHRFF
jgi:hypothetical protein